MRWLLLLGAIVLGGCAGSPWRLAQEQHEAEEAKNVAPTNYKADLLAFMRTYLNDPTNIRNAAMSQPQLISLGPQHRYVACVRFNAKASSGQYGGMKDTLAVFISGKLDSLIELGGADGDGSDRKKPLRELCAAAAYQPFPELERLAR
jgi:hypothetical protein